MGRRIKRYEQRDDVLKTIGFSSYESYLRSDLYASIRRRVFRLCSICPCGRPATEIHHRTYKKRYLEGRGRVYKYLVPICRQCHDYIEFDDEGNKVSLGVANERLNDVITAGIRRGVVRPKKCKLKSSGPLKDQPICPRCGKRARTNVGLAAHMRNSKKCTRTGVG